MFTNIKSRIVIVGLTLGIGVILIIVGLAPPLNEKLASIVFTFGVTFTASAVISIIGRREEMTNKRRTTCLKTSPPNIVQPSMLL